MPCVRCNQTVKFADLIRAGAGPGRGGAGDRALCAAAWTGRAGRSCTGAVDAARDQSWFLFATRASSWPSRVSSGRRRKSRRCGRGGAARTARWRTSRTARTSASSCRERCRVVAAAAEGAAAGRDRGRVGRVLGRHRAWRAIRSARRSGWGCRAWWRDRSTRRVGALAGTTRRRGAAGSAEGRNWLSAAPALGVRCMVKLRARDVMRPALVSVCGAGAVVELEEAALPAPVRRVSRMTAIGF